MQYLLILQILIAVVQPNLEARRRVPDVRGELRTSLLCLILLVRS